MWVLRTEEPGQLEQRQAYYRCRFPTEYALANKVVHPKVVYLREAEIIKGIDTWLVTAFSPSRIGPAIEAMTAQARGTENAAAAGLRKQLATCDQRLNQYRAALNAGADAVQVAEWLNETEQERARLEGELRGVPAEQAVTSEGLAELLHQIGNSLTRASTPARTTRPILRGAGAGGGVLPAESTSGSQGGPGFH
ncbi:hypothetical protein [Actinomadura sp. NPDC049753]|uniref:hypothetical protein n=1 Tax=Actinomadura sp. NPDC049753 TaxID=3154739 RepID=UPI003427551E